MKSMFGIPVSGARDFLSEFNCGSECTVYTGREPLPCFSNYFCLPWDIEQMLHTQNAGIIFQILQKLYSVFTMGQCPLMEFVNFGFLKSELVEFFQC
jgi:hypothetical protein